ncbi:MAG TPA: hypothetical protein VIS77_15245 [Burkholderiales bacterium]
MHADYDTAPLGQLPLDPPIREHADSGKPAPIAGPVGRVSAIHEQVARRCAVRIAKSQEDMTSKPPNIVVQNT